MRASWALGRCSNLTGWPRRAAQGTRRLDAPGRRASLRAMNPRAGKPLGQRVAAGARRRRGSCCTTPRSSWPRSDAALVPPRPDDGHTSLEWRGAARASPGRRCPGRGPGGPRSAPDDLVARGAGRRRGARRGFALDGRTRAEAVSRGSSSRRERSGAPAERLRSRRPTRCRRIAGRRRRGASRRRADGVARRARALVRERGRAAARRRRTPGPAPRPVRVWPHHFDVGACCRSSRGTGEEAPVDRHRPVAGRRGHHGAVLVRDALAAAAPEALPELPAGQLAPRGLDRGRPHRAASSSPRATAPPRPRRRARFLSGAVECCARGTRAA